MYAEPRARAVKVRVFRECASKVYTNMYIHIIFVAQIAGRLAAICMSVKCRNFFFVSDKNENYEITSLSLVSICVQFSIERNYFVVIWNNRNPRDL